jgi:hypothetical protein
LSEQQPLLPAFSPDVRQCDDIEQQDKYGSEMLLAKYNLILQTLIFFVGWVDARKPNISQNNGFIGYSNVKK